MEFIKRFNLRPEQFRISSTADLTKFTIEQNTLIDWFHNDLADQLTKHEEDLLIKRICDMAKANGVDVLYLVDQEKVKDALMKHLVVANPIVIVENLNGSISLGRCMTCGRNLAEPDRYCPHCGQRLR